VRWRPKGEAVEASLESGLDVELLFCLLGALDNSGGELVLQAVPPVAAAMFAATRRLPPVITVSVLDASAMAVVLPPRCPG
jgi:hypothetical protein